MSEPAKKITLNPLSWVEPDSERRAICLCGKMFTQERIALRFVESLAKGRGEKAAQEFMRQIPDGYVPVNCPKCESETLGHLANKRQFNEPLRDNAIPRGDR
jgi:hypothetical protein